MDTEAEEIQIRYAISKTLNDLAQRICDGRLNNIEEEIERSIDILQQYSSIASTDVSISLQLAAEAFEEIISFTNRQNAHIVGGFLNTLRRTQGPRGAPYYDIPEHILRSLVECHFGAHDIAKLLGVSIRTIRRRMSDYGISILSTYSGLSDYDLENEIISIISEFPHVGYRTISAILKTKGHRVQFSRVRSAVRNVDPQGTLIRRLFVTSHRVQRRTYSVRAPLALWHLDGNHKLIR